MATLKTIKTYGRRNQRTIVLNQPSPPSLPKIKRPQRPPEDKENAAQEVVYSFNNPSESDDSQSSSAYAEDLQLEKYQSGFVEILEDEPIGISTPFLNKEQEEIPVDSGEEDEVSALLPGRESSWHRLTKFALNSSIGKLVSPIFSRSVVTEDDLDDITQKLDETAISDHVAVEAQRAPGLDELLKLCHSSEVWDFEEYFETKFNKRKGKKLGEATFSEVFELSMLHNDRLVAVKIILIGNDEGIAINGESVTRLENAYQELLITKTLSDLCKDGQGPNFVRLHGSAVVRGLYPSKLLQLWDRWDREHESENDRPSCLLDDQLFLLLLMESGGRSLEDTLLIDWDQAVSFLQQVTFSLAIAEKSLQFEHRDLHWGNVLIKLCDDYEVSYVFQGKRFVVKTHGIRCCIIDYTFSRLNYGDNTILRPYDDEDYFTGSGDYQYDIYRMMRGAVDHDWTVFEPRTNVMWIHYLVIKLLEGETVQERRKKTNPDTMKLRISSLKDRLLSYSSTQTLLEDPFFLDCN